MVIDFHTHIFPDGIAEKVMGSLECTARMKAYTDGTEKGLEKSMSESGIDYSVLLPVATNIKQPHKLNILAISANEKTENTGLISFGAMHPEDAGWKEELKFIYSHGIKGIKLHPAYQKKDFDSIGYLRIIEKASELGLIIMVHAGMDIGIPGKSRCSPEHIKTVVKETCAEKLVLAHMGGWRMWNEVESKLAGLPVYMDTSFAFGKVNYNPQFPRKNEELGLGNTEKLVKLIRRHGTDKILFGTDSPWGGQKETLKILETSGLTENELKKIEWENGARLLSLKND